MKNQFFLQDENETLHFGKVLAKLASRGQVIFLVGDLGAGKTTFVRGYLRALGFTSSIKSPTFALVEEYHFDIGPVFHFDLYRLDHPEELEAIGIREYFDSQNIVLVEWPEKGENYLPKPNVRLNFKILDQGRQVTVEGFGNNDNLIQEIELQMSKNKHT